MDLQQQGQHVVGKSSSKKCNRSNVVKDRRDNWSEEEDTHLIHLLNVQFDRGNFVGQGFNSIAWRDVEKQFQEKFGPQTKKEHMQNRLRVLKKVYHKYRNLCNRTGWGWDPEKKIPIPDDHTYWDHVIAIDRRNNVRSKPLWYYDLFHNWFDPVTATGEYGVSTVVGDDSSDSIENIRRVNRFRLQEEEEDDDGGGDEEEEEEEELVDSEPGDCALLPPPRWLNMRETGEVTLGMPGPWAEDAHEAADHYTTKVGGVPDLPTLDVNPDMLECGSCGGRLSLVAQVYAPIVSGNFKTEERTIYVLSCLMPKCTRSSNGWRTLRVQKCKSGSQLMPSNQEEKTPAKPLKSTSDVSNWWAADAWMLESGDPSDRIDDDLDLQELSKAISEAASLASCTTKQNASMCSGVAAKDLKMKPRSIDSSIAVLPCFYIYNQEERSLDNISKIHGQYSSLSIKDNQTFADSTDDEKWENESYEYDKALGVDRTYLKFKKRLEVYPEQCIRYSFGGKPLLATNDVGEPGNCELCGAQRHYEMQLMPPLLYFLQQAADGQSTYLPEDWSWMTIIIYTCSKNCVHQSCEEKSGGSCWTVSEESTFIQHE
uniref:Programmed cell death protein 2-like n=1 Tax=Anthurium amnicola TaxID=1678845 RepID=A0A1D1XS56_9ARAE